MENINDIESFDKYLHNELSEIERLNFQNKLESDSRFRQEFELHRIVVNGIFAVGNNELKVELDSIHEQREQQFKKRVGFYLFFMSLIFLGFWLSTLDVNSVNTPLDPKVPVIVDSRKVDTLLVRPEIFVDPVVSSTDSIVLIDKVPKQQKTFSHKEKERVFFELKEAGVKMVYKANVAKKPQYMYFKNTVHLVGWKSLSPEEIDLRIHENKLYLWMEHNYYELKETGTWSNAERVEYTRGFGEVQIARSKSAKITVLIHPIKIERSSKRLHLFTTDSIPDSAWYSIKDNSLTMSNSTSDSLKKAKLVTFDNQLYMKTSKQMFLMKNDETTDQLEAIKLAEWEGKEIIEIYVNPNYLNFEDAHNFEQTN